MICYIELLNFFGGKNKMKKFTKILSLLLCLAMLLSVLISCASKTDGKQNNSNADDNAVQELEGDFYDENGLHYVALDTSAKTCEVSVGNAKELKEIVIPETQQGFTVTSIAKNGFANCEKLESISIPKTIESIGTLAFLNCENLATIELAGDAALKKIAYGAFQNTAYYNDANNWQNGVFYFGKYLIEAEKTMISCEIKDGTKVIAENAFYGCTTMTSLTVPASVKYIGAFAFNNCKNLSVKISDLKAWCSIEFANHTVNPLSLSSSKLVLNGAQVTDLYITSDITSVSDYAFYGYKALNTVYFSKEIKTIGTKAFDGAGTNNLQYTTETIEGATIITYHVVYEGSQNDWKAVQKSGAGIPGNDHVDFQS